MDRRPARKRRRIAVVGGGPGGLEAARSAALRGHAVTLFEASDGVGGQFLYAASLPHRADLRRLIDYLQLELRRLAVQVELGARIDGMQDLGADFDAAVVATGAVANPLEAGWAVDGVMTWFDVLAKGAPPPAGSGCAVMVDDGSAFWWTYGVAEALVEAGWQVLIATPSASVAAAIPVESVGPLLARLGRGATSYRVLTQLEQVTPGTAHLVNLASGASEKIACDLVVVQTGRTAVTGVEENFRAAGLQTHVIGDCVAPRRVSHALFEAQRLAHSL